MRKRHCHLVYMDDCYYLVAWNDKHESTTNYRVDRMLNIDVSEEDATSNEQTAEFDAAKYQKRVFGMYSGEAVAVTLLVKPDAISTVIDRFGDAADAEAVEDGSMRVRTKVMQAPTFYGWLATLGTSVIIEQPQFLKEEYRTYLQGIIGQY